MPAHPAFIFQSLSCTDVDVGSGDIRSFISINDPSDCQGLSAGIGALTNEFYRSETAALQCSIDGFVEYGTFCDDAATALNYAIRCVVLLYNRAAML